MARAVGSLGALATAEPRVGRVPDGHNARLCYGHLGGALGSVLLGALLPQGLLEPGTFSLGSFNGYRVTARGDEVLRNFGIDIAALQKQRRHFAKRCLNTDEANAHLSGSLAEALLKGLLGRGWVVQDEAGGRSLAVTAAGKDGLADRFGVRL